MSVISLGEGDGKAAHQDLGSLCSNVSVDLESVRDCREGGMRGLCLGFGLRPLVKRAGACFTRGLAKASVNNVMVYSRPMTIAVQEID